MRVDVSGVIVTIDAVDFQKEIAGVVVAAIGDYVLARKENQGTLHQAAIEHLMSCWDEETAHGRREPRTSIQFEAPENLLCFKAWQGLKAIDVAISEVVRDGKTVEDVRY